MHNLSGITIPDTITSIGISAFQSCSSLKSISIPDGVKEIGHDAFFKCINLEEIVMPYDVTEIGEGTFYNCTNLSKVTIPDSANGNCGGILFNYEFKATNVYHAPVAYTRKITLDELEAVLQFHNENNYYNANHNCTTVAIGAWAAAFGTSDGFTARKNSGLYASFDTPTVLKEQILTKKSADTSYKDTMQNILQNWK